MLVGHEAQDREDSKTCYKAGAAVQTTQHDAVPEEQDHQKEKEITLNVKTVTTEVTQTLCLLQSHAQK